MTVREAAVAGMFYSDDPVVLSADVNSYLKQAKNFNKIPQILVSPHAGFIYSGLTAGFSYKQLENIAGEHFTFVLVGPSHRVGFEGFAFPFSDIFRTPLGNVSVNQQKIHTFMSHFSTVLPVFKHDIPHKDEHSLETQLPFLQSVCGSFDIIPIVYGKSDYNHLCAIFEYFLSDTTNKIIISSDLSHYHEYEVALDIDSRCNLGVKKLSLETFEDGEACGKLGIKAAIKYAQLHGLSSVVLDYRTSGDTAGSKEKVVGYASYMFYEEK